MHTLADIMLGGREWLVWAAPLAALALVVLAWSYRRAGASLAVRLAAAALKAAGIVALAICLIEPLASGTRPRPGENLFLLLADNSRSLQVRDGAGQPSRGEELKQTLAKTSPWRTRLAQDFDVRPYAFDTRLQPLKDASELSLDGDGSTLAGSLALLAERFRGRPTAGVLLFSDGNATDLSDETDWQGLPPVYPVVLGADAGLADVSVARVSVSQTNFEAAPVTVAAEIDCQGVSGKKVITRLLDESGNTIERRETPADGGPIAERFQLRPERPGISFYTVRACLEGEEELPADSGNSSEATLANNERLAVVDRGGGPYRVLYVSGRPNWEFKFLRRALAEDDEVNLVGLLRIAKKEPKFTFRGRPGERTNPLYRGFGNQQDEEAEQYDEPVLLRLGTQDKEELKGGFPKAAEALFAYQALILDDVEAAFFTHEQLSLIQQFVSQRGGGFLMLGGHHSFSNGEYDRTPVGDLLPVYLRRQDHGPSGPFRLLLTREGWLQPWVRSRANEQDELRRLADMPPFEMVNQISSIKPGASVLAEVRPAAGEAVPALVVQQFGRGRAAALTIGDLWRWNLRRKEAGPSDLEKSWRQTVRWLVADVPSRVEAETERPTGDTSGPIRIIARARDQRFEPLDNAAVRVRVRSPDGREIELTAEPSERAAGEYTATFSGRVPGAYRATVTVTSADAAEVGRREIGWAIGPAGDELRRLRPNRELLERIAQETGGEIVEAGDLDSFVADLPNRKLPIVETWTWPLWHQWQVFLLAVICLSGEWILRRWKGMP
jgi:uncharacterized membrane protein